MSKKYNLDGDIYRIVDIPISELEGQKLAPMEYKGIYRLDNGHYLKAQEWLSPEWDDEGRPELLGAVYYEAVYYDIYKILADDAIAIDGGVMEYDLNSTLEDFNEFLAEAGQGQITRKIGGIA